MFNSGMMGPSLADIAAVTRNGNNNDGFGNGGWWAWIIIMAMFGWGGEGFGWGGNRNCGGRSGGAANSDTHVIESTLQRGFDTQTVINKLDGINSGLCSLGYDQLAQMNGINGNVTTVGYNIERAIQADTVANMQNQWALSRQISDCCCEDRMATKDLQYTMATDTCALKNEVHQTGDSIVNTINWNSRNLSDAIKDGFAEMQRQNDARYIASLERQLNNCDRDSALQRTANYIINTVDPRSQPAYLTCNPNTGMVFPNMTQNAIPVQLNGNNCGCNNGCGSCCGNNF